MKREKFLHRHSLSKPGVPPFFRGGLQARMIVSYLGATLIAALFFQIAHSTLFFLSYVRPKRGPR